MEPGFLGVREYYLTFLASVIGLATLAINILFAIAVYNDAEKRRKTDAPVLLVDPLVWTFATFIGGVFVAVAYWVVNCSTLRKPEPSRMAAASTPSDELPTQPWTPTQETAPQP